MDSLAQRGMMRVRDAARFLSLSASYLNKLRCSGGGPAFCKVGRRVLYHPDDLERWLDRHRRVSTSDDGTSIEGSPR